MTQAIRFLYCDTLSNDVVWLVMTRRELDVTATCDAQGKWIPRSVVIDGVSFPVQRVIARQTLKSTRNGAEKINFVVLINHQEIELLFEDGTWSHDDCAGFSGK